jgi:hypothetical protein
MAREIQLQLPVEIDYRKPELKSEMAVFFKAVSTGDPSAVAEAKKHVIAGSYSSAEISALHSLLPVIPTKK